LEVIDHGAPFAFFRCKVCDPILFSEWFRH